MSGLEDRSQAPRREFPPPIPPRKNSIFPLVVCIIIVIVINISIYDDLTKHDWRWTYIFSGTGLWIILLFFIKTVYHYYRGK